MFGNYQGVQFKSVGDALRYYVLGKSPSSYNSNAGIHPTRINGDSVKEAEQQAAFAKKMFGITYKPLGLEDVPKVKKRLSESFSYKSPLRFDIEVTGSEPQILFADHIIAEGSGKSYTFRQLMNYWGKHGKMSSDVLSGERGNDLFIGSGEDLLSIPEEERSKLNVGSLINSADHVYRVFTEKYGEEPVDARIELKPGTMVTEKGTIVNGILGYARLKNSGGETEEAQIAPDGNLFQMEGDFLTGHYVNMASDFANAINPEHGIFNFDVIKRNDVQRASETGKFIKEAQPGIQESERYREIMRAERTPEAANAAYNIMKNAVRTGKPERIDMAVRYLSAKYRMSKNDIYHLIPHELPRMPKIRTNDEILLHTALQFIQATRPELYSFDLTDSESSSRMVDYLNRKHLKIVEDMKRESRGKIFEDVFDYVKQATDKGKPLKDMVHNIQGSRLGRKADILLDISGRNHTRNYVTRAKNLLVLARDYGYDINVLNYEHEVMRKSPAAKKNQGNNRGHQNVSRKTENRNRFKGQNYRRPAIAGFRTIKK